MSSSAAAAGGVSFELNEDQKAFQLTARQFADEVMIPNAAEYDKTGEYPKEIFKQAWELGFVNTHVDESIGGMHLDCMTNCVIMEELARGALNNDDCNRSQLSGIYAPHRWRKR